MNKFFTIVLNKFRFSFSGCKFVKDIREKSVFWAKTVF